MPASLLWVAAGLLIGATSRFFLATDSRAAEKPANPNVVILRTERIVTIEGKMTLSGLASALAKSTGLTFTLDPSLEKSETEYGVLLARVPLSRALQTTGYLTQSIWERRSHDYHLRPMTPEERAADLTQYEAAVDLAYEYLSQADENDPSVPRSERMRLQNWLRSRRVRMTDLAPLPMDTISDWRITRTEKGLNISYQSIDPETRAGSWRSESWSGNF